MNPWSYRTPDPVDRAWIQGNCVHIQVVTGPGPTAVRISQIFGFMKEQAPYLFDGTHEVAHEEKLLRLPVIAEYDAKQALAAVATLWRAATQRHILTLNEPPVI